MDDQVGRLVQTLREQGIAEDTIVIFTSDHGDNLGSHGRFNKNVLFEESIRIPLIVSLPGLLQPRVVDRQVAQLVDIFPTVLSLCGLRVPDYVQGRDLKPLLLGQAEALAETCGYIETDGRNIGIRTPKYLYGMHLGKDLKIANDRLYFFNLERDPYQYDNLIASGREPDVAKILQQKLRNWHEMTPWHTPGG